MPLIISVSLLTACGAYIEKDRNTCTNYGYMPGTVGFATCMERQDNKRIEALNRLSRYQRSKERRRQQVQTDCTRDNWGNYRCISK